VTDDLRTRLQSYIDTMRLNAARRSPQYKQAVEDAISELKRQFAELGLE
jgi:hypothetical protein